MCEPHMKRSVFTRGEKCIFFHIVATFSFMLVLLIIFFIHLCLVKHAAHDVLKVYRRSGSGDSRTVLGMSDHYSRLGVVFVLGNPSRVLCGALLLKPGWSLVPGHCAAARSHPDLADYLPGWRARYTTEAGDVDTAIRKSVPHPQFDTELFANNVGVLQHETPFPIGDFIYPKAVDENLSENLELVAWDWNRQNQSDEGRLKRLYVYPMPTKECQHFVSSVTEVRSPYEFCVIAADRNNLCFEHGALVYSRHTIVGLFSWGERCGKIAVPLIVVNVKMYQGWLEDITSLTN